MLTKEEHDNAVIDFFNSEYPYIERRLKLSLPTIPGIDFKDACLLFLEAMLQEVSIEAKFKEKGIVLDETVSILNILTMFHWIISDCRKQIPLFKMDLGKENWVKSKDSSDNKLYHIRSNKFYILPDDDSSFYIKDWLSRSSCKIIDDELVWDNQILDLKLPMQTVDFIPPARKNEAIDLNGEVLTGTVVDYSFEVKIGIITEKLFKLFGTTNSPYMFTKEELRSGIVFLCERLITDCSGQNFIFPYFALDYVKELNIDFSNPNMRLIKDLYIALQIFWWFNNAKNEHSPYRAIKLSPDEFNSKYLMVTYVKADPKFVGLYDEIIDEPLFTDCNGNRSNINQVIRNA